MTIMAEFRRTSSTRPSSKRKRRLATNTGSFRPFRATTAAAATAILALGSATVPTTADAAAHAECSDDADYRSSASDLSCAQHVTCESDFLRRRYGYDDADILSLRHNCPETCGLCGGGNDGDASSTAAVEVDKAALGGTIQGAGGLRGTNNEYVDVVNGPSTVGGQSCHAGWHPFCQDDESYLSHLGFPCWFHTFRNSDCYAWSEGGYSRDQVLELVTYCPCSCRMECGRATYQPTGAPTDVHSPSPSGVPTSTVSALPSATSTSSPSKVPTVTPSAAPTPVPSASPTMRPTSHPTPTPSVSPSMRPTSHPTPIPWIFSLMIRPTSHPTASPSPSPTAAPTPEPRPGPTQQPTTFPTTSQPSSSSPTSLAVEEDASGPEQVTAADPNDDDRPKDDDGEDNLPAAAICPPVIFGLVPATADCRFAIHCAMGHKTYGPVPCPNDGVFDMRTQNCVHPTPDFECQWDLFQPKANAPVVSMSTDMSRPPPSERPTRSPTSSHPTKVPSALLAPLEDMVDVSEIEEADTSTSNSDTSDGSSDTPDESPIIAAAAQSSWSNMLNASTEEGFSLQLIVIIASVALSVIIVAVAMFSLGRRMNKKSKKKGTETQVNIKRGDKMAFENMGAIDDMIDERNINEDEFVPTLLDTFKSKGDSTSIKSAKSANSLTKALSWSGRSKRLENPSAAIARSANPAHRAIEAAKSQSMEASQTRFKQAAVQQIKRVASHSEKSAQDLSVKALHDGAQCGDRVFSCVSDMLCLPNDVDVKSASTWRKLRGGSSRRKGDRSRSSRRRKQRHAREYSEGSSYEDI